ncbi:PP2C family serine/threonine-protein phosphatase [Mycobacterium sp. ACS4331]|uniref:PP2C family serine/threonine-protein phosphatase n=1 Tax=Mycobacterium sp. ACS4331 TaxID=1834121 RepID=UPI0009EE4038|nr:PP2C family serine/threonine-protein phosphatase [Mycobacterium sp. ACS4331]
MTTVCRDGRQDGFGWAVCGASVTGQEHERRGLGCDDAYSYGVAGDFIVAAVADGAGSVTGTSAWGAHAACRSVLDRALQPRFIEDYRIATPDRAKQMLRWLFDGALERVTAQAGALGLDVVLLSTTLSVAVVDRRLASFGQIGDGVIAADLDGGVETLLVEPKDEYANTTSFLQSERALENAFRTTVRTGVTAFALSTDGMSYKITNIATGEPYEPFFRGSWQHVRAGTGADQLAALLRGITDDQTGDDKTLVLAATEPESAVVSPGPFRTQWSDPPSPEDIMTNPAPQPVSQSSRAKRRPRWWR